MANYDDPRWQKRRLEVFERDGWKCCGCASEDNTLVAHHKRYKGEIWESPLEDLQTLCKQCHEDLGPHPKGGVWWERDELGGRILHVEKCPACGTKKLKDKGSYFRCIKCDWSTAGEACKIHAATEGRSAVLLGREINAVYLAGKMGDKWRDEIIKYDDGDWSAENHGICTWLGYGDHYGRWRFHPAAIPVPGCDPVGFCGPYWNSGLGDGQLAHQSVIEANEWYPNTHANFDPYVHDPGDNDDAKMATMARCRLAIEFCDLFFAWIDSPDAYGTLVEIGMAMNSGCHIVIALGPTADAADLWFPLTIADVVLRAKTSGEAWNSLWTRDGYRSGNGRPISSYAAETMLSVHAGKGC